MRKRLFWIGVAPFLFPCIVEGADCPPGDTNCQRFLDSTKGLGALAIGQPASAPTPSSVTAPRQPASDSAGILPIAGFAGCRDWDILKKVVEIAGQKDKAALSQILFATVTSGECVIFGLGDRVYAMEWSAWSNAVRLRPEGEVLDYWTNYPAGRASWTPDFETGKLLTITEQRQ